MNNTGMRRASAQPASQSVLETKARADKYTNKPIRQYGMCGGIQDEHIESFDKMGGFFTILDYMHIHIHTSGLIYIH